MYNRVIVRDIQSLSMMPSLGAMLGNTHSTEVLDRLNMASGCGVIFGQPGDPLREQYKSLRALLTNDLQLADSIVERTRQIIYEPERMVAITSIEGLYDPPKCMHLPILMYEPVRTLLEEGRISGYDIDPKNLPEEDVYGRLINNGRVDLLDKDAEFVWEWKTDDPVLTDADLEAIEATRGWLDSWLLNEMGPGGLRRDPTDPSNNISAKEN